MHARVAGVALIALPYHQLCLSQSRPPRRIIARERERPMLGTPSDPAAFVYTIPEK